LFEKITAYWHTVTAILAAATYLWFAQKDMPFLPRVGKVVGACLLGVSVAPEIAVKFGTGQNTTLVAVITLGWVVLDAVSTLIHNRALLVEMITRIIRGGGK
jgi:hypothetical protein